MEFRTGSGSPPATPPAPAHGRPWSQLSRGGSRPLLPTSSLRVRRRRVWVLVRCVVVDGAEQQWRFGDRRLYGAAGYEQRRTVVVADHDFLTLLHSDRVELRTPVLVPGDRGQRGRERLPRAAPQQGSVERDRAPAATLSGRATESSWYVDLRGGPAPDSERRDVRLHRYRRPDRLWIEGTGPAGVDALPKYENAVRVRAAPGNIIRHSNSDAYLINGNWTRSWIKDGGSFLCLSLNGHTVKNNVPRYYIDDLPKAADVTSSCWNATVARGHVVRAGDGSSWYVDLRGGRHWIPNGGTYDCIVAQGRTDYGSRIPIAWVNALTKYENAVCVRAAPGNIIRHSNGDGYLINSNWTRSWIRDGGVYSCLTVAGHVVVNNVPRYYIDDLAGAADLTFCPAGRVLRLSNGTSWYVGNDLVKHPIPNGGTYLCLTAWKAKPVVTVTQTQANLFTTGSNQSCTVTEVNDRVIKVGSTSWYVDTGGTKHPIPNGGTYLCLTAWKGKPVQNVTQSQADAIPTGGNQSCTVTEVNDRVIVVGGSSWYVDSGGTKHPIPDGGTYRCLTAWRGKSVQNVTQSQADAMPTGGNQGCSVSEAANRVLRQSNGTAWYVDGNLTRHHIVTGGAFNCLVSVRQIPVLNGLTQEQMEAFPLGGPAGCSALLVGPDGRTSYYINGTDERYWVPNGNIFNCLAGRGVPIMRYTNWNTINLFAG